MPDIDVLHDELQNIWPYKRTSEQRREEKDALYQTIKNEQDYLDIKNIIEIKVADTKKEKLPRLVDLILSFKKKVTLKPIVSNLNIDIPIKLDEKSDILFETLFAAWPKNEIKQNKKLSKEAFQFACRVHSLEDIDIACTKYINNSTDPKKAHLHILGMKRFLSENSIFNDWLERETETIDNYDLSPFNAAYAWYPDFAGKEEEQVKKDSLGFYKRFITGSDIIDFWCAIRSYRYERKEEQASSEDDELKYTKKFYNFIRCWKKQERHEYLSDLIIGPLIQSLKDRQIPYTYVYEGEMNYSAIMYHSSQVDENGEEICVEEVLSRHINKLWEYLKKGKTVDGIIFVPIVTSPDLTIMTEVVEIAKKKICKMPPKQVDYPE